jgi:hypothetical protein
MLAPVNRCQSPISTVSPSPVRVEIPRIAPSRATIGAHCGPLGWAAIAVIAASRRSRRAVTAKTVQDGVEGLVECGSGAGQVQPLGP